MLHTDGTSSHFGGISSRTHIRDIGIWLKERLWLARSPLKPGGDVIESTGVVSVFSLSIAESIAVDQVRLRRHWWGQAGQGLSGLRLLYVGLSLTLIRVIKKKTPTS